ncbi:MAG TPA: preprotein translocase subunit SecG [Dehalococcoidia bacterium]|nr:preprotein translocase subunit SecG [Dehalococcoidia bacterium]
MSLTSILQLLQIVVSVLLILAILLQVREGGLGEVFGGGSTSFYGTRRGLERRLFQFTIFLVVLFIVLAIFIVTHS